MAQLRLVCSNSNVWRSTTGKHSQPSKKSLQPLLQWSPVLAKLAQLEATDPEAIPVLERIIDRLLKEAR